MIPNPRSVALRLLSTGRSGADHTRRLLVASALAIMLAACALPAGRDARAYNTCIARHPGEAVLFYEPRTAYEIEGSTLQLGAAPVSPQPVGSR